MSFLPHKTLVTALLIFSANSAWTKTVQYQIDIRQTEVNFTGTPVSAITLNGNIPAPTLEANVGDRLRVTFNNHLDTESSIHWHGVLLPNDQDGIPNLTTQPIAAKSSFTFDFPITHHGTYWYHSHTGLQEQRGVYGALVFHPENERIKADTEQVIVLSDWTDENPNQVMRHLKRDDDYYALKKDSAQSWSRVLAQGKLAIQSRLNAAWIRMPPMDLSDIGYDTFLVNGANEAQIELAADKTVRLRLINASASSYQHIQFAGGAMQIVAADGVDVQPLVVEELTIAIAETYDVIVSVPDNNRYELRASAVDGTGYSATWIGSGTQKIAAKDFVPANPLLSNHMDHSASSTEMMGEMAQMQHNNVPVQTSLGHYQNLRALEPVVVNPNQPKREVTLRLTGDMNGYRWSFNNTALSVADRILVSRGERVRFTLKNDTMMDHPLHLHGHFFRVLTDQGEYSPIKHTVNVPRMTTVVVEFDANEEKDWFFHCHNLYHMKAGMARVVRYDDFNGDPNLSSTIGKVGSPDNQYWSFADVGLLSSKGDLSLWRFNNKSQWSLTAEHDWQTDYEVEADYQYYVDRFLQVFTGVDFERQQEENTTLAVAGAHYLLPGLLKSEWRLDHKGDFRLEVGSEIQLSQRIEFEWYWNTDDEYGLELNYELNKSVALKIAKEEGFGLGAGIELRF